MTRGKFILVTKDELGDLVIRTSTEFNGDMYPGGHYEDAVELLRKVVNPADFPTACYEFNKTHHNYQDEVIVTEEYKTLERENGRPLEIEGKIDFRKYYYENWFSDYLFLLNLTGGELEIIDSEGNVYMQPDKTLSTLNFGAMLPTLYSQKGESYADSHFKGKVVEDVDELDEIDEDLENEEIARMIKEGFTSGWAGKTYWELTKNK